MSAMWAFDNIKNKHSLYHGKDCMKKFCNSLREHGTSVINFERNKMSPLIKKKKELHSHQDATLCYICGKRFQQQFDKDKNY